MTIQGSETPNSVRLSALNDDPRAWPRFGLDQARVGEFMNLYDADARPGRAALFDAGLEWTFMDTDSCAVTMPDGMDQDEFVTRTRAVLDWFEPLKPYRIDDPLFKLEDANFAIDEHGQLTDRLAPLYCFAVSAKRYCLFNIVDGRPVLRKASAYGLGHLLPPYRPDEAPESIPAPVVRERDLGVSRWQHDLWYRIVLAALEGHPEEVDLMDMAALDRKAISRYAATTPALLRLFDRFNAGKPYSEQVRPFGFLLCLHGKRRHGSRLASTHAKLGLQGCAGGRCALFARSGGSGESCL